MMSLNDLSPRRRFRLVLRAILILLGGIAAFSTSLLIQTEQFGWSALPALGTLLFTLGEFVLADVLTERRFPTQTETLLGTLERNLRETEAKIQSTIRRTIDSLEGCNKTKVSGAFHLVVELYSSTGEGFRTVLVQVTDYSGALGGKKWRFTDSTKGVIGRCLRTGITEYVNFRTLDEYERRMVTDFGFTPEEAHRHTRQARSYIAHPVRSGNRMVGVLYLFSTEVQTFPYAIDPVKLDGAATEIAAFLEGSRII